MKYDNHALQLNERPECVIMPATENHDSFALLYRQYWSVLVNFAGQYVEERQTCEEIVQDLFVHLYVRGISVKLKCTLTSYLFIALRNRIFNYFRDRAVYRKHMTLATKERMTSQNNVEQAISLKELQTSICASLKKMPARYSQVYLLKQEQLTVKQISKALNRPPDTVEKQLRKAKKMLTEQLERE